MTNADWEFNCWTGNSIYRIEKKEARIVRMAGREPHLYRAEWWGDYSLEYPKRGPWRGNLEQAKKDVKALERAQKGYLK
jgi:hypothetical protein